MEDEINNTIIETKIILTLNEQKIKEFADLFGWHIQTNSEGKIIIITNVLAK